MLCGKSDLCAAIPLRERALDQVKHTGLSSNAWLPHKAYIIAGCYPLLLLPSVYLCDPTVQQRWAPISRGVVRDARTALLKSPPTNHIDSHDILYYNYLH